MTRTQPRRTVTICIPPREDDPEGMAHFFRAVVEGRTVVSTKRIEAPKPRVGGKVARCVLKGMA